MKKKKIFIAGHNGMVGSAILRKISCYENVEVFTINKKKLNLLNQTDVENYFNKNKFDEVYLAAAKVGGIYSNNEYPAEFIYHNLMISANVINSSYKNNVKKILYFGSSCIYPKLCEQPIEEKELLSGYLEKTNEAYAIAKIAGLKMCESYNKQYGTDYRCIMPSNLYGINDTYDELNSHVIPSLIFKIHNAKKNNLPSISLWGTGNAKREFLNVNDLANASIFVMNLNKEVLNHSHINIGSGIEYSIKELAEIIAKIINYKGEILFNLNNLDGTPRKLLNNDIINKLGWKSEINLYDGILLAYKDFEKRMNI